MIDAGKFAIIVPLYWGFIGAITQAHYDLPWSPPKVIIYRSPVQGLVDENGISHKGQNSIFTFSRLFGD